MMATNGLIQALGWALLHFVWQGAAIAGGVAVVLRVLRGAGAQVRYAVACCGLAAMLTVPLLTMMALVTTTGAEPGPLVAHGAQAADPAGGVATLREALGSAAWASASAAGDAGAPGAVATVAGRFLPLLVLVWSIGVVLLSLRTLAGWMALRRLTRGGRPLGEPWPRRLTELMRRVGVATPVRLLQSPAATVPMVIGWLRPVILLPPAALAGLTTQQLEAVLLHELAHIRRHDHLVNLLQIVVETLLFYNPAVWWLSTRIREEREHCCDDVAAATTGGAVTYAQSLLNLEELRRSPVLAIAATGGSLVQRVRRLLAPPPPPRAGAYWVAGLLFTACIGTAAALHGSGAMTGAAAATASPVTTATAPAIYIVVEAGEQGVHGAELIAAALANVRVSAVYTTSDRRTLAAARPLADMLDLSRIPYDFSDDPGRFARHLLNGSLMANLGRVAIAVLPPGVIPEFVQYASGSVVTDPALQPGEVFIVEVPGTLRRVRID